MSASSGSGIPADKDMVPLKSGECKKKRLLILTPPSAADRRIEQAEGEITEQEATEMGLPGNVG